MRISDWSSDVCSSDLERASGAVAAPGCCALSRDRGAERLSRRREYAAWPLSLPGPDLEIAGDQRKPHARHHVPHGSARQGDRPRLSRPREPRAQRERDRKSTRLNSVTNAQIVCRLLLEIKTTHLPTQFIAISKLNYANTPHISNQH